jgi:putative transposase
MSVPARFTAPFLPDNYYHIICKSLTNQKLFVSDENKRYFLKRYKYYLWPFTSTLAFCLLNNHVHFVLQVSPIQQILNTISATSATKLPIVQSRFINNPNDDHLDVLLKRQFNSFFVSYTKSFNNYHNRKGHLFESPFKRIHLKDDGHISQAIIYVHANAQKHKLTNDFRSYEWSSYQPILSTQTTLLAREKVLRWFSGKEGFIAEHKKQSDYYYS